MKFEELKAFEKEHAEFKPAFKPLMERFDSICREEFGKAFKAINERMTALTKESIVKYNASEEDTKVFTDAITSFLNQIDKDFRKNVKLFFSNHTPEKK